MGMRLKGHTNIPLHTGKGKDMNRADYEGLLNEVMDELSEPGGNFQGIFGAKTESELAELRYIAGIALCAADRLYSGLTRIEFQNRETDENE